MTSVKTWGNTWKDIGNRLGSNDTETIHRLCVYWDDSNGAQEYAYKGYDKDRVLVAHGPVRDMVPIHHGADDRTLVSAMIWVGFGLKTAIHRSDCIVETTDDNVESKYVVWDRVIKPKARGE